MHRKEVLITISVESRKTFGESVKKMFNNFLHTVNI